MLAGELKSAHEGCSRDEQATEEGLATPMERLGDSYPDINEIVECSHQPALHNSARIYFLCCSESHFNCEPSLPVQETALCTGLSAGDGRLKRSAPGLGKGRRACGLYATERRDMEENQR
ncbi:hypothetical protein SKAU_G00323920 [Synaphobranchus kaupii]|uniref:Uncharacterized protein n=1 Tax=Synaphobranchus kaupii TaxID=118154 RepID=A0A9Q1IK62_SYNKA|nr:hypothetical protein SKAU_G00323920 [Synaphobranchus kaupii]